MKKVRVVLSVDEYYCNFLKSEAERLGVSVSVLVSSLIKQFQKDKQAS